MGKNNNFFAQELFDKTRQFLGKISRSSWALLFLPRNYLIFKEVPGHLDCLWEYEGESLSWADYLLERRQYIFFDSTSNRLENGNRIIKEKIA